MNLHYQQHGNDSNNYTFDLPDEHDIYEVGFRIGALNNDGTVTYTHTDETTQVNILEGQDNSNVQTMFEDVIYNIYDTLETFIDSFTITINDWSLLDDISFKYVTTTTTTTTPPNRRRIKFSTTIYIHHSSSRIGKEKKSTGNRLLGIRFRKKRKRKLMRLSRNKWNGHRIYSTRCTRWNSRSQINKDQEIKIYTAVI